MLCVFYIFLVRIVTHEFSFLIGAAKEKEDLNIDQFAAYFLALKLTPGAAERFVKTQLHPLLSAIDDGLEKLSSIPKDFKDFIAQELAFLVDIRQLDLEIRPRDYFQIKAGGWAAS